MEPQWLPEVVAEIAALPSFDSERQISTYLESSGTELRPETLVYIAREVMPKGYRRAAELTARLLHGRISTSAVTGGHCEATIRSVARKMGLANAADLDDVRGWVFVAMWQAIGSGRETAGHRMWEERFRLALRIAAIDAGRKVLRQRAEETAIEGIPESEPRLKTDGAKEVLESLELSAALDQLRDLRPKPRQAAYLRWIKGYPVESKDPKEADTVAQMMGVSGRMVRKYLTEAAQYLRKPTADRDLLGETGEPHV